MLRFTAQATPAAATLETRRGTATQNDTSSNKPIPILHVAVALHLHAKQRRPFLEDWLNGLFQMAPIPVIQCSKARQQSGIDKALRKARYIMLTRSPAVGAPSMAEDHTCPGDIGINSVIVPVATISRPAMTLHSLWLDISSRNAFNARIGLPKILALELRLISPLSPAWAQPSCYLIFIRRVNRK